MDDNSLNIVEDPLFDVECMHGDEARNDASMDELPGHGKAIPDNSVAETQSSNVFVSPGGTKSWIPEVAEQFKPVVGMVFASMEDAIGMYKRYADVGGFEVRQSTTHRNDNGVVIRKYLVCNRNGVPRKKCFDSSQSKGTPKKQRNSSFKVTDCKACIKLKNVDGSSTYKVYDFVSEHNHRLLDDGDKRFTRKSRQLDFSDQMLIQRASCLNMGATRAHKLQANMKGGYDNMASTSADFKNFARDLKCYVGDADCDIIVRTMNSRKENGMSFEYKIEDDVLTSLFWADELAKTNYSLFGDVISFDATYRTNKYAMIFVPFTAVDNHRKSVIVGAGLLSDETVDSYSWLLDVFLKVHGKQPRMVLTDEDAAMRNAIAEFFPNSRHRLCMWHIMDKVPSKVSGDVLKNSDFKSRLSKLVWNVNLDPAEFEVRWNSLIDEHHVQDNGWLASKYAIREEWIPAYFKDVHMCGLMKTTSRSESMNSCFNTYSNSENSIVEFMFSFDNAMDKQRHRQRAQAYDSFSTSPALKTKYPIEKHASLVYSRTVFFAVQKEIEKSVWTCHQWNVVAGDGHQVYTIRQKEKHTNLHVEFEVTHSLSDGSFSCSCNHYQYYGFLCRHVFTVLINLGFAEIPVAYIHNRWRIDIIPMEVFNGKSTLGRSSQRAENIARDILYEINQHINFLWTDEDKLSSLLEVVRTRRIEDEALNSSGSRNKGDIIKDLLGVSRPESIEIHPPKGIRNKGCGKGKRLVGPGEKVKAKVAKPKRLCKGCGEYTHHDKRTCQIYHEKQKAIHQG